MRLFAVTMFMAGVCVMALPSPTHAADEKETFVFAYRLLEPQTKEFEDSKKGEAFVKALGKLGCKSKTESHEGHMDVTYQQPRWTLVTLQSEELVHKWQDWLTDAGCETLHSEDPEHEEEHDEAHKHEHDADMEVIAFQTTDWIEKHFEKAGTSVYEQSVISRSTIRRERMGFVFQTFNLIPYLTALENVQVPLALNNVSPVNQVGLATAMLQRFGLGDRLNHKPSEMSVGRPSRD